MSNKKASYVEQYYLADGKAVDVLAKIDNELYNMCIKKIRFSSEIHEEGIQFPAGVLFTCKNNFSLV